MTAITTQNVPVLKSLIKYYRKKYNHEKIWELTFATGDLELLKEIPKVVKYDGDYFRIVVNAILCNNYHVIDYLIEQNKIKINIAFHLATKIEGSHLEYFLNRGQSTIINYINSIF